jgi:hypothetical protein
VTKKYRNNVEPGSVHYLKEPALSAYKKFMKLVLKNPGLPCESNPEEWTSDNAQVETKRKCVKCVIYNQCREYALVDVSTHGVWGGMDDRDRQAQRRADQLNESLK